MSGDFVFGGRNLISSRTVIQLQTAGEAAFEASNPAGGIGLLGTSGINDVSNPMNIEAGLWAAGKNGAFGGWVQSEGKPGLLAISDQIGSLAIQGMYSDAPQSDFLKAAAWNYSKDHFGTWSQSLNGVGSLSVSDASVGALNISGMYGDLPPEMAFIKAGSWNYSKFYVGGWNASEESFGSLSLSMSESSIGAIATSGPVYSADQLGALDAAGFHAAAAGAVPGTCSVSQRGPGVIAMSDSGVGLIATSGNPYTEAQLAGVDAAGLHSAAAGNVPAACFAAELGPVRQRDRLARTVELHRRRLRRRRRVLAGAAGRPEGALGPARLRPERVARSLPSLLERRDHGRGRRGGRRRDGARRPAEVEHGRRRRQLRGRGGGAFPGSLWRVRLMLLFAVTSLHSMKKESDRSSGCPAKASPCISRKSRTSRSASASSSWSRRPRRLTAGTRRYHRRVPAYICPNCKQRSVDIDGREGFSKDAPACHHCGFGFLFELLDDYYPGPNTGFVVCDQEARVLATGHGVFELTGYREQDLLGRRVTEILGASEPSPVDVALEWGVRRLGEQVELRTRAGQMKRVVADLFPAYDDDGGLLVALSPAL